jgi:branched-chain amino acid transport system substrate-binding protein
MKRVLAVLCVLLIAAGSLFASGGSEEPETLKIGAIFAVTGGASFLGAPEAKTAEMVVDKINAAGGINGKMIELIIKDSAANPEKAISFAKQLIEEDKVLAIIGPSTSGETLQIKDICNEAKVPMVSAAASELIVDPVASYVFKTPQKDSYVARWIYQTMNDMGIKKIGVVAANTGFGNGGKGILEKFASEFGIEVAISESYDRAETDLTALMNKVKAAGVEAVVNWSIVPAQSIIPKNMKQLGMEIPLFQSHGFGNIKYVEAAGEAAEGIIFPCGRLLVANELADSNPQKAFLVEYNNEYKAKFNEDASTFGGHAYDAITIVAAALEKAGADRDKIRDEIEKIKNFPGTGGVFNFSAADHNGLGMDSIVMLTVKNGKFVLLK